MRFVLTILLAAVLVPALVAGPAVAEGGKDCKVDQSKCKKAEQQITNFICDVTIPWLFRKHVNDTDGDGVYDGIDRCPNTPKGVKVDEYGCTEMETEFLDKGVFRTSDILFDYDKSNIKPVSYTILDQVGTTLAQWPELKIEIGGHTDAVGTDENNQKLSEKRAQAVLEYLAAKHPEINQGRFTTQGYGESTPIATNDTPEGRTRATPLLSNSGYRVTIRPTTAGPAAYRLPSRAKCGGDQRRRREVVQCVVRRHPSPPVFAGPRLTVIGLPDRARPVPSPTRWPGHAVRTRLFQGGGASFHSKTPRSSPATPKRHPCRSRSSRTCASGRLSPDTTR